MKRQRPDDQNNLMLAVILSMAVLLAWQLFYAGPQMKEQQERALRDKQQAEQEKAGRIQPPPATEAQPREGTARPEVSLAQPAATRETALGRSPRVAIDTPSLKGSLALKGGLIDDLVLVKYRETVEPTSPNVILSSRRRMPRNPISPSTAGMSRPTPRTRFRTARRNGVSSQAQCSRRLHR
jgi:YidC/Oxa1 family membrane protein insertase